MKSKLPEDWENQLKEQPFAGKHFTPQMQRQVEQRAAGPLPRKLRLRTAAAVLVPVLAITLVIGYGILQPGGSRVAAPAAGTGGAGTTAGGTPGGAQGDNAGSSEASPLGNGPAARLPAVLAFPSADNPAEMVNLPLTAVLAAESVDDGSTAAKNALPILPEMTFPLSGAAEDKLQATLVYRASGEYSYLLLAPSGWSASAVIGANGSYGVTFQNPADSSQTLSYTDNAWGCQGCAVSDIGQYFPDKAKWAEEQGFPVYEPLAYTQQRILGTTGADARTVRYTLAPGEDERQTEGAAYYEEGSWGYLFRRIELIQSTGALQQEALETIMNFFAANHGALSLPSAGEGTATADSALTP